MICDAILYNGEYDIFKLRYEILKSYVDEFVVVEFGKTFSGMDKEAHPINLPKVSYHFFTQVKDLKPDLPPAFAMEYNQREMIKQCLSHLDKDDVVVIGDCDEIWNPTIPMSGGKYRLLVYTYNLNNRSSENFVLGPIVGVWKDFKSANLNDLRSNLSLTNDFRGWHFTNMGGLDKLKYKIESYGHQEYNIPEVKNYLPYAMEFNKDYIGRDFKMWVSEDDWPPWLKEHRQDYQHMLK